MTPVGSDQVLRLTHSDGDCCPVWSPDGRSIAFSRYNNKEFVIYVVPTDASATERREPQAPTSASFALSSENTSERKIDTSGVVPQHGELAWSPDGKFLAFSGSSGIYLLSLDHSTVHRLTESPAMAQDWGPTFSPDGERILFVRNHQVGLPDEIWFTSANGGEASRILSEPGRIVSAPQWSYDGRAVIYSSNRSGHPTLWRAALDAPDSVVQIKEAGSPAWDPSVSRRGYRMAVRSASSAA